MTAYAKSEETSAMLNVTVEMRSYNSRYLDIALRIPHTYSRFEDRIKAVVSQRLARGRIEIHLQIRDVSDSDYFSLSSFVLRLFLHSASLAAARICRIRS